MEHVSKFKYLRCALDESSRNGRQMGGELQVLLDL